jgi:hypothetical protein
MLLDRREWAFVEAISSSTVSVTKVRAVVIEGGQQMRSSDPHEKAPAELIESQFAYRDASEREERPFWWPGSRIRSCTLRRSSTA